jgi:Carboxypeptidase regulatory-like domain
MKNLFFIPFFLLLIYSLQAQNCEVNAYAFPTNDPTIKTVAAAAVWDSTQPLPAPQITGYLWSNGATTPTIDVTVAGQYCVVATFDNGCSDTDCQNVNFNTNPNGPCHVNITSVGNVAQGYYLIATGGPDSTTISYAWSTGASGSYICAPTQGLYCVTATDANTGCMADTCITLTWDTTVCSMYLFQNAQGNLSVNGFGQYPISYLWDNGSTDNTLYNPVYGNSYCVTVTDATGCSQSACITAIDPISTQCDVYLWQSLNYGSVSAGYGGTSPVNEVLFTWSDPTLPDSSLVYPGFFWDSLCVTILTPNGCTKTKCIANAYIDKCIWAINRKRIDSQTIALYPFGPFGSNATYLWSTGATTDTIYVSAEGTYSLTVNGDCTGTDSIAFEWSNDLIISVVNITVSGDEDLVAWVIRHDEAQGSLEAIAETYNEESSNFFLFDDLPQGEYLIKGAARPNSPDYLTAVPTYCKSDLWWHEGTKITIPSLIKSGVGGRRGLSIDFIQGQNPGGPGFVGGLISEGANLTINDVDDRSEGDPIYAASILIFDANEQLITGVFSNANGGFEIPNLAYGMYKVVIDAPGLPQHVQWITISPAQSNIFLEIEVKATGVATYEQSKLQGLEFGPNPVLGGKIWVKMPASGTLSLKNMEGKSLAEQRLEVGKQVFDLAQVPSGIYMLEAQTVIGRIAQKIIVGR